MGSLQINNALVIRDSKKETVFSIIGRMEVLLEYFAKNSEYRNLIPFLRTYYTVTKSVAEKNVEDNNYFDNYDKLERLDVHFANLYFKPLKAFLMTGRCQKPWQHYFHYCMNGSRIPFVQMLLGINAHINTDLALSLSEQKYREKKDFQRINDVLEDAIPDIMRFLALKEHDLFGLGGMVFKGFINKEFHKIIVKWRRETWKNAQKLEHDFNKCRQRAMNQTELVSKEIISLFDDIYELRDPDKIISGLNKLSVKL